MISRHHDVATGSGVWDEAESEGGDGVLGVAEGSMELLRLLVPRSHLEVDLRAATFEEEFTSPVDRQRSITASASASVKVLIFIR
jgi:hypothetical protein